MSSLLEKRRSSWVRITIYIAGLFLLVHYLVSSFNYKPQTTDSSPAVHVSSSSSSLPWYTSSHPNLTSFQHNEHIKTFLTTKGRHELTETMVTKARSLVAKEFPDIEGIPGSSLIDTQEKAKEFRSRLECWTTGEWVPVETPQYIMPHFQDPLYGSCERKYKQDGLRPAVKYEWRSKCEDQVVFSPSSWCQVLNGRNLLIVGDLVQYQLHEVLLDTLRDGPAICFGELNCKGKDMW